MTDLAFIGLGAMGTQMALRLLAADHRVKVWNRSTSATEHLVQAGATAAHDVADTLDTGIVLSMLSDDNASLTVFDGAALSAVPPGSIHVNLATLSVAAAEALTSAHEQAGVSYIAAPVFGRPQVAAAGNLSIVVAGNEASIARVRPILDILARRTWVVGATPSTANLIKIGVNYKLVHTLQSLAESIALVERGGVDARVFTDILLDSAYTGTVDTTYGRLIAHRKYEPVGFSIGLGLKDLSLAEQAAADLQLMLPSSPILRSVLEQALASPDLSDLDWSAIAEVTRRSQTATEPSHRSSGE
ncbi:NAD(P)-dependent oxidoreductase [Okibacterium endophyticum]